MIPVRFEPEAQEEYVGAGEWYAERGERLPARLADEVDETLRAIATLPTAFPLVKRLRPRRPVRKARLRKFPFFLVYIASAHEIRILAVAHTSRRPLYWRGRVGR